MRVVLDLPLQTASAVIARADGRTLDMGVWLSPKRHYGIQSVSMNGSQPLSGGGFTARSRDDLPMRMSNYTLYDATGDSSAPVPTYFCGNRALPKHCSERASGLQRTGWLIAVTPMSAREQRRRAQRRNATLRH